jgi:hypothetical protein
MRLPENGSRISLLKKSPGRLKQPLRNLAASQAISKQAFSSLNGTP